MAYIIAADDDHLLGELIRLKFEASGHRVLIVENGQAALAAIAAERPDALILDAMMPMMSGQQVVQRVRADAATADLPIVMLTARRAEEDVVAALQLGVDEYITKPFMPGELLLRVENILARRAAMHAAS